ncbi:uncharacterized protein LOC116001330 [Ipomoea triloba]|uniref:uncharacterized protein LOC116001330 n=1 Tax=Ipomoea triloba TaxID=35885 RepID=UPI00125E8D09|nr:uncharacterized protein LOC116001330 [Ipomoea triloba]
MNETLSSPTEKLSLTGDSAEEVDLLRRSKKKTKRGLAERDDATMEMEEDGRESQPIDMDLNGKGPNGQTIQSVKGPARSFKGALTRLKDRVTFTEDVFDDEAGEQEDDDPDCPVVKLTKEEKKRMRRRWENTLIIKVLGKVVGYNYLLRRLRTIWNPKSGMDLIAIQNGYFLVRFASVADYEHAKLEGPWTVLDHCLAVKEWEPNFDPMRDETQRLLVWVRFPCLPIEYYDYEFLMRVGDMIGKAKKVDHATSMASRGLFARVCVEVDITKPLLARFTLRNKRRTIEYEGLHLVCFKCGMVGHRKEGCKVVEQQPEETPPEIGGGRSENTTGSATETN